MLINQIKTFALLGLLSGFVIFLGKSLAGTPGIYSGMITAVTMSFFLYFFSSNVVLALQRARPITPEDNPSLYATTQELCQTMNIPMPKIYYVPSKIANAFATGRNPQNAVVGITDGILNLLDHNELRGVLAHELSHIQNRDTLLMTVASTMAATIGNFANIARRMAYILPYQRRRHEKDDRPGALTLFLIVTIMPLAAILIRLAISRNREYIADETGARASRDPLALASALEKMHKHKKTAHFSPFDLQKAGIEPLFIVSPLWGTALTALFSTHPPVEERIARLRKLYEKMF